MKKQRKVKSKSKIELSENGKKLLSKMNLILEKGLLKIEKQLKKSK